jgi:DNA-binding CsgD family transcriptional regulator
MGECVDDSRAWKKAKKEKQTKEKQTMEALEQAECTAWKGSIEEAVKVVSDALSAELTHQEEKIVGYLFSGLSHGEIAAELGVVYGVVKWHLGNVYRKAGISNPSRLKLTGIYFHDEQRRSEAVRHLSALSSRTVRGNRVCLTPVQEGVLELMLIGSMVVTMADVLSIGQRTVGRIFQRYSDHSK